MDRRLFLASATAVAAATLTACTMSSATSTTGHLQTPTSRPEPPRPSSPDAAPSGFSAAPLWQGASILAVHAQFLVGTAWSAKAVGLTAHGLCPAVTNLSTGATTVVLPDGAGGLRTVSATLDPDEYTRTTAAYQPSSEAVARLHLRAALLDSTHAYLVVGAETIPSQRGPGGKEPQQEAVCPVHLLRVRLADGHLEAVRQLSAAFSVQVLARRGTWGADLALSFSPDRRKVLVAGSSHGSTDFIGLQLRAHSLAVELDVHDLLPDPSSYEMQSFGQAVVARSLKSDHALSVMLPTGSVQEQVTGLALAHEGWCYYDDGTQMLARSLETDQTLSLRTDPRQAHLLAEAWPRVSSDSRDLVLHTPELLEVLRPGQTAPVLRRSRESGPVPRSTVLFGDVAYNLPAADSGSGPLDLLSLTSGQRLQQLDSAAGWMSAVAVSSWGLACENGTFYPATSWF